MELIELIFRLGVLFAIYGFLWFFIEMGLQLLSAGRKRTLLDIYLIKLVKYLFLVNVTFLFCLEQLNEPIHSINYAHLAPTFVILMVYFLGRLQKSEQHFRIMSSFTQGMNETPFHRKWEIAVIFMAACAFAILVKYPDYATNAVSSWFQNSILDIEGTVIIGFVFKVIGFFFLLGLFAKMLNALNFIISGKPMINVQGGFGTKRQNKADSFDDYEELDNDKISE